jgi:hypothetical protein
VLQTCHERAMYSHHHNNASRRQPSPLNIYNWHRACLFPSFCLRAGVQSFSQQTLAPNLQTDYSPLFESFHPNATINTQVRQTNRRDETHHYHRHPLFRHHRHGRSWSCKYTSPQRWPAYALPREPTTALDSPLLELPQALLRKRQRHHLRGPCDRRRLKGLHRVPLLCEFTILIRFLSGPVRLRTAIEKRRGGG